MEKIAVTLLLIAWFNTGSYLFSQAIEPIVIIIKSEDNTRDRVSENNYFQQEPDVPKTRPVSYPEQTIKTVPFDLYKGEKKFIKTYEGLYSQKTGLFLGAKTALLRGHDFNSTLGLRLYNRHIRESIKVSTQYASIQIENTLKAKLTENVRFENPLVFRYNRDEQVLKSHAAFTESVGRVDFKQAVFIDYPFGPLVNQTGFLYQNKIDTMYTPSFCFTYRPEAFVFSPAFHFDHKAVRLDAYTDLISNFQDRYIINWDFYFQARAADKFACALFKESSFFNRKNFSSQRKKAGFLSGETYKTAAGLELQFSQEKFSLVTGGRFYFNDYFLAYAIGKNLLLSYPDMLFSLDIIYEAPAFRLEAGSYVFFNDLGYRGFGVKTHFKNIQASFVTVAPGFETSLEDFFSTLRTEAVLDLVFTISDQAAMFLAGRGGIQLSKLTGRPVPDYLFRAEGGITIFW